MGVSIEVDMSQVTGRDLIAVEKIVGRPVSRELQSGDVSMETAYALISVLRRKVDPSFTYDQALDLPISELNVGGAEPDPTPAAGIETPAA